ncbi:hypothetical protein VTI74DRAFT_5999 [Chaetomium olivicolor]
MNGAHPPLNSAEPGPVDIHQPFTTGERIHQLLEIDNDIASLLAHLSSTLRALATPPGASVQQNHSQPLTANSVEDNNTPSDVDILDSDSPSAPSPLEAFKSSQAAFFNTVDRIDKHLTRQILAMEEAGIITLRGSGAGEAEAAAQGGEPAAGGGPGKARAGLARLEPDGMGRYGTLDVGKLNLASSTVERDMEAELWRKAKEEVERIAGERGIGSAGEGERDRMEE